MREIMLIFHFIGLAMGLGTSIGMLILGIASSKMPQDEGPKFMMKAGSLSIMGHIGLGLLIVSGGYLATPYWKVLGTMPTLIAKLVLVLLLTIVIGVVTSISGRVKRGKLPPSAMAKARPLGMVALLLALAIVVLAVYTFH
jgi:uncharacterized membrane protein